ncbi:MAG: exo-beta-N-acetylmuramidase NamZ domain-containing protein [Limisphaerales bacterium]|jgi:uncharacterized protein YbbC (DUF1343 family)
MKQRYFYPLTLFLALFFFASLQGIAQSAAAPPRASVFNGIDVLKEKAYAPLQGKKIALLTNQTGQDKEGNSTIDLLYNAPGVKLMALFAPEHGIRGDKDQAIIEDGKDSKTGLPIYSLYGKTRKPSPEQLAGLDAVVFDIQDIGCRFYTYISSMAHAMEACAEAGIQFIVLDRINPINGRDVEGPVEIDKSTFVGIHPIALRHGMTIGELARMFNEECQYHAQLTVIELQGWKRKMWQDETDIPWVNPSPNMRSLWEATLYPGIGVLEFTPLATGRGTAIPFELLGAPYIQSEQLARRLSQYGVKHIDFTPFTFTPTERQFAGQPCHGLRFNILNRDKLRIMDVGIALAQILHQDYPSDYALKNLNTLLLHTPTMKAIEQGSSLKEIHRLWAPELKDFKKRRASYLLYK